MPVREKQPRRAASWRAVKHQAALLLGSLGRDKPHAWPVTASQIASASAASFFCRLRRASRRPAASAARYGRLPGAGATNDATLRRLQCQRRTVAASEKNASTYRRLIWRRISTFPAASTPWTWNTDFAMSRPIVLTICTEQIGPWHIGQWIDFKHTAIRIRFRSVADRERARETCTGAAG